MSTTSSSSPILDLRGIGRWYGDGAGRVEVLSNMSLTIQAGESVAIVGPSGCGKSTLLHVAGLLDAPNAGEVWMAGARADNLPDNAKAKLRNQTMGFVYQHHHLLREFTALENVAMPARIARTGKAANHAAHAAHLLEQVGLGHRVHHYPTQLSGGEQQRVAIARALMNKPSLLLADEPTGNLDPATAEMVTDLLFGLIAQEGMAAMIVTHNPDLAKRCGRMVRMGEG